MSFFGVNRDSVGMPVPFYSYQIIAADLGGMHGLSAVATIWSATGVAMPAGSVHHIPLTQGGVAEAVNEARVWLLQHPAHQGLQSIG